MSAGFNTLSRKLTIFENCVLTNLILSPVEHDVYLLYIPVYSCIIMWMMFNHCNQWSVNLDNYDLINIHLLHIKNMV